MLLLVVFAFLSLQNMLGYFFQIRRYQKMIRKWLGKGVLGVGQRRGLFRPGEVCVVVYNPGEDKVITVQSMRGYSIFVRFKEKTEYAGIGLEALRAEALSADAHDLGLWRLIFRYKAQKLTKRKGALIQAVEGVEKRIEKKNTEVLPAAYTGAEYGDPVLETPAPLASRDAAAKPAVGLTQSSWAELSVNNASIRNAAANTAAGNAGEGKHE